LKYLGKYEVKLDEKGRFLVPKALREKLPEDERSIFYISRNCHNQKCLAFYTEKQFEAEYEDTFNLEEKAPEVATYIRLIFGEATECKLDSSDRILIDKGLLQLAGIKKDMIMISAGKNKLELWDIVTYRQFLADNMASLPELTKMMGSNSTFRKNNPTNAE
jgi:MraZ protein